MNSRPFRDAIASSLHSNRTIQEMHHRSENCDHHDCGECPIDHECQKRKSENIEPNVDPKQRIIDSERLRILKKQPVLPLRHCGQANQQTK